MRKFCRVCLLVLIALLLAGSVRAQVIVIASNSVKSSEISKSDLRDVFLGAATSLKDGSHVVPILLKGGTAHEEFLKAYIGKNDAAYRAGWRNLVFTGEAAMPKNMDGDVAAIEFVAHNSGAIAYISKETPHEGVKVLAVR